MFTTAWPTSHPHGTNRSHAHALARHRFRCMAVGWVFAYSWARAESDREVRTPCLLPISICSRGTSVRSRDFNHERDVLWFHPDADLGSRRDSRFDQTPEMRTSARRCGRGDARKGESRMAKSRLRQGRGQRRREDTDDECNHAYSSRSLSM